MRQDLRLEDNPALNSALGHDHVLPVYILDDESAAQWQMGAASRWWLHQSLKSLSQSCDISFYKGQPEEVFERIAAEYEIEAVYWNRCYEPWRISRDKSLKEVLTQKNIKVESANGSLLWEPWEILKADKTPYRVFTPFYRRGCLEAPAPRLPETVKITKGQIVTSKGGVSLDNLDLMPKKKWYKDMESEWQPGEGGAHERLESFMNKGLANYQEGRNLPAQTSVSRLSPHLHFGEISVHTVWDLINQVPQDDNADTFKSELGWREFSYSLLYFNPEVPTQNLQSKFDGFPWEENKRHLARWQKGLTGYPIVDAGMRELWQTGYMHNRVRMIVGSFLVKNLLLDWRDGEKWFWDTLVDADLASNSASWQWIAGCGMDAAPYFRIFNPITQGEKFDPNGVYMKKYVPELRRLPKKYLFKPWEAPQEVLDEAGVSLGEDYPYPLVDVKESRERALAAFKNLSKVVK